MAFEITGVSIAHSTICSGEDQRKHQSFASLAFVTENSPVTSEFPDQRASNAENVSIWLRHHVLVCNCGRHNLDLGPISPTIFSSQFKFRWKFRFILITSSAVACAKFCCDLMATNGVQKSNVHTNLNYKHKLLGKWDPSVWLFKPASGILLK